MCGKFIPTHPRNKAVSEFVDNNFALDRKIKEALADVPKSTQWLLMELPRDEDKELITDFIINWSNESDDGMSMSPNTKTAYVSALVYLARHHNHKKSFKEMSPEDFFSKEIIIDEKTGKEKKKGFLENIKRKFEDDIEQKWVNTYNNRGTKCLAFWKW